MIAELPEFPEFIDTHIHLEHEYPFSTDDYLSNAKKSGVKTFVTIGTRPESLETLKDFAEKYPEVYFTVGIHPHEAKDFNPEVESKMRALQSHPKCVAVGEVGLDYHYDHSPRDIQRSALERQLELAREWKKPVVIHAREAEDDLLDAFRSHQKLCPISDRIGIIHCFSGTARFAQECLKLGFYISFSGIVTFKKADDLRQIALSVPEDKILLETDSPFLAPMPHRGKPNQSAYLVETAKQIASLRNIKLSALAQITTANAKRIFAF